MSPRLVWLLEAELPKLARIIQARVGAEGQHEYLIDTQETPVRTETPAAVAKRALISELRKQAGRKSASVRAAKFGSAQPAPNKTPNKTEHNSPNKPEQTEQNAEQIYKLYPKRDGATRKQYGLRRIAKQMKTQADWDDFRRAVEKYAKDCVRKGTTGSYVMQFGTFCGDPWKEYAEISKAETKTQNEKLALRFDDEVEW